MNQFGLSYIYAWKFHKETPCIAILNEQKCHFFSLSKLQKRRIEQVLSGGVGTSGRGEDRGKECRRVKMV
jgi:hypothetical protein